MGRTSDRPIYWVRGSILGLQGRAIHSMCLGSRVHEQPANPDELTTFDRHEVAHVVLSQFLPMETNAPALVSEGWADVGSGLDPRALRFRVVSEHVKGEAHSLSELVGPRWYVRHDYPVYAYGAVVVDYIIREFGADRFLELLTKCRQATFDADCRRILGLSVDQLDQACLAGLEPKYPGEYVRLWLSQLALGPGVDRSDWNRFVAEYVEAAGRILAPYQHVRLTASRVTSFTDDHGKPAQFHWKYELQQSEALRSLRVTGPQLEEVYLARPGHSFRAQRKAVTDVWESRDLSGVSPERRERAYSHQIDMEQPVLQDLVPLFGVANNGSNLVNPLYLKVSKLKHTREGTRPITQLELQDDPPGDPNLRWLAYQFDPSDCSALLGESMTKGGHSWRVECHYETRDGARRLKSTRSTGRWGDGTPASSELTVTECRFEIVPESEFTAEHLLKGEPVNHVSAEPLPSDAPAFLGWYRVPLIVGLVCMVVGAVLLIPIRSHSATFPGATESCTGEVEPPRSGS
jgi:hypothetical protein